MELRDRILRYFAEVSRVERVIEKNNTVFVDEMFFPFLLEKGISFVPRSAESLREPALQAALRFLRKKMGEGYGVPMDEVLTRPPEAPSWEDIRRMTQMRVFVSSIGLASARMLADETLALADAIAGQLGLP